MCVTTGRAESSALPDNCASIRSIATSAYLSSICCCRSWALATFVTADCAHGLSFATVYVSTTRWHHAQRPRRMAVRPSTTKPDGHPATPTAQTDGIAVASRPSATTLCVRIVRHPDTSEPDTPPPVQTKQSDSLPPLDVFNAQAVHT